MAEPSRFHFDSDTRSVDVPNGRRRVAWLWVAISLAIHGAVVLFVLAGAARGGHSELIGTLEITVVGAPSGGNPDGQSAEAPTADDKQKPDETARPETPPQPAAPEALPRPAPAAAEPARPAVPELPRQDAITPPVPKPAESASAPRPAAPVPPTQAEPQPVTVERAPAPPSAPETTTALPLPPRPQDPNAAPAEAQTRQPEAAPAPARPPETAAVRPAPTPPSPQAASEAKTAPAEPAPSKPQMVTERPAVPEPASAKALPPRPKAAPSAKAAPNRKAAAAPKRGIKTAPEGQTASLGTPSGGDRLGRSENDDSSGILNVNLNPRFRSPPPPPRYPRLSVERDEEGVVLVRAFVDAAGAPQRVMVFKTSGFPLLDDAALKAVQGWRFEPMVRDGRTTAAWVQVPVRFRLN